MERLAENVFTEARPFRLMGADLRARMTVIRIGEDLLLHSPVPVDDALAEELDGLGRVRWLVAPCDLHHLFIPEVKARYPDALVVAAPTVGKRNDELEIDLSLPDEAPLEWSEDVGLLFIEGMPRLNETAFFHRPSGTLIFTDFLFNQPLKSVDWYTGMFLRIAGAYGGPRQTSLLRSMVRDRFEVRKCRDRLLAWDFARISVCHGDVIEDGAKDALSKATAWL